MTKNQLFFTQLLFFLLLTSWSHSVSATCQIIEEKVNSVTLSLNGNTVVLMGWEHIVDEENSYLKDLLLDQVVALENGDSCVNIKLNLQNAIVSLPSPFKNFNEMYSALDNPMNKYKHAKIAIEMTPNELREHLSAIQKFQDKIKTLQNQCEENEDEVSAITNVLFGPEYGISQKYSAPLVSVENQIIKDESAKAFASPELDSFDYNNPAITSDGQNAIDEIRQSIMELKYPDEATIDRVISFENDPAKKQLLKKDLEYSLNIGLSQIQGAFRRNTAIAMELSKFSDPVILPIGFRHVIDLKDQLLHLCEISKIESQPTFPPAQ